MFQFSLIDSIAMFFIYAFVGWVVEVIYYGINEGKFVNRGFLNGPLCPVYGFGFYGVIVALTPVEDNFPMLFFGSMLITTVVEFLAGFILYKAFELRWWDYRDRKFNVLGFICLRFSIYWGIACSLAMKMLHPTVMFILEKCPFIIKIIALAVCAVLLVFDLFETIIAVIGFKKKIKVITDITGEIKSVSAHPNADSLRIFEKCLDSLFYALREKYPDGYIGYVTPWYLATKGFKPVVKVIRRMCRKHSVPLLDNYKKSSVIKVRDAEFRRRYFQSPTDTAHLNDSGHDLFLPIGEQFIISLVTKP